MYWLDIICRLVTEESYHQLRDLFLTVFPRFQLIVESSLLVE